MNNLIDSPCHHCEKRSVGCHGKCADYKEYRKKVDKATTLERSMRSEFVRGKGQF